MIAMTQAGIAAPAFTVDQSARAASNLSMTSHSAQNEKGNTHISGCTLAANTSHKNALTYFRSSVLVTANTAANAARFRGFKY